MGNDNIIKKATVLVVDTGDDTLSREVADILAHRVKDIRFAKTPSDGLQILVEVLPQIVILDIQHSVSNIVDFSAKIKHINHNAELVIVLGFVEPHKLIELVDLDVHRFVMKPITVPKLTDAVSKAMETIVEKAVSCKSKSMQDILNAEDTPVFSTDGNTIVKANKAFLECFGARSLNQFSAAYPNLKAAFGADNEEIEDSEHWFREFLETSEEPKVLLYDNRLGEKRVFLFRLGSCGFEKNYFVVTMTDVSDMEASYAKKIEMLSSQMLSKEKLRFRSMLELEVARCKRYKKVFSVIVAKFDVGDELAVEEWDRIFKITRHTLRSSDIFAKIDKNQLAIIATETNIQGAKIVLDRLQKEFDKLAVDEGYKVGYRGCASEFNEDESAQTLLKKAIGCAQ